MNIPDQISVTMYDVGFGDCFLLTFHYRSGKKRRVLIDCGSTSKKKDHMSKVVDQLVDDCEGHVDVIVATHRHRDHISAFGIKSVGDKLESLNPDVVIQPWTEHPDAAEGALKAPSVFTKSAINHMIGLEAAQTFALHLTENPSRVLPAAGPTTQRYLTKIASLSIYNKKAILRLTKMGKRHAYVYAGSKSGLERLLPGVKILVLGPPTLKQSEDIINQTRWDEAEFWKLQARQSKKSIKNVASAHGYSNFFPGAKTSAIGRAPSYIKWVIGKLDNLQLSNVQRIVRDLDNAINNTSVILLFQVGGKALLFSGDAQLENWQYALGKKENEGLLKHTLLYKIGHHGSTNATPKSLWNLFEHRKENKGGLITLLSTEAGHHNRVPRESLVNACEEETDLHSTERWRNKLSETYFV